MLEEELGAARRLYAGAAAELQAAAGPGAGDETLIRALQVLEEAAREIDATRVQVIATLQRRGAFAERGYRSAAAAVSDLLDWERAEAHRIVTVAEAVGERTALDGSPLPPQLPATAAAFAAGRITLRHAGVITRVLRADAAGRLAPQVWTAVEAELADKAALYSSTELASWARQLVDALDSDGADPDDERPPPAPVDELHLTPHPGGSGGTLRGRFDSAELYDAIATAVDALATPADGDDTRSLPQRQAGALADVCGHAADHDQLPRTGGRRPHLTVLIELEDLERRARSALLDFGGRMLPAALRALACDAAVVPIVLGGDGQPLDVGRARRTVPDGLRRAVTARDRGCAFPGCDRPPSWCEVHHIVEWEHDGPTEIANLVMLCRHHHRLVHASDWVVRMRDGLPELVPPRWIDVQQRPRRQPRHDVAARAALRHPVPV